MAGGVTGCGGEARRPLWGIPGRLSEESWSAGAFGESELKQRSVSCTADAGAAHLVSLLQVSLLPLRAHSMSSVAAGGCSRFVFAGGFGESFLVPPADSLQFFVDNGMIPAYTEGVASK